MKEKTNSFAFFTRSIAQNVRKMPRMKQIFLASLLIVAIAILAKIASGHEGGLLPAQYEPSPDLTVEITTVCDNSGHFMVRNTGKQVISDFTIAYVGYDSNGIPVKSGYGKDDYDETTFTSVNLLPGQVFWSWDSGRSLWLDSNVKYLDAAISATTYKNGRERKVNGLPKWAKDTEKRFSIDSYARTVEHMRSAASKAETASELEIISSKKYNDNQFSNKDDLKLRIKNTGQNTIKDVKFILLQYDSNGYGIGDGYGNHCVRNASTLHFTNANLPHGNSCAVEWSLLFEPQCRDYKLLVFTVEYTDGTIWKNEYAMQWMLYNEDKR